MATALPPLAARVSKVRIRLTPLPPAPPDNRPPAPVANVKPVSAKKTAKVLNSFSVHYRELAQMPLLSRRNYTWDLKVATHMAGGMSLHAVAKLFGSHPLNVSRGILRATRRSGLSLTEMRRLAEPLEGEEQIRAMLEAETANYQRIVKGGAR